VIKNALTEGSEESLDSS